MDFYLTISHRGWWWWRKNPYRNFSSPFPFRSVNLQARYTDWHVKRTFFFTGLCPTIWSVTQQLLSSRPTIPWTFFVPLTTISSNLSFIHLSGETYLFVKLLQTRDILTSDFQLESSPLKIIGSILRLGKTPRRLWSVGEKDRWEQWVILILISPVPRSLPLKCTLIVGPGHEWFWLNLCRWQLTDHSVVVFGCDSGVIPW